MAEAGAAPSPKRAKEDTPPPKRVSVLLLDRGFDPADVSVAFPKVVEIDADVWKMIADDAKDEGHKDLTYSHEEAGVEHFVALSGGIYSGPLIDFAMGDEDDLREVFELGERDFVDWGTDITSRKIKMNPGAPIVARVELHVTENGM